MHHIALCCLEGSTMSNLVHRRRRCARLVPYMVLLPGGQYARGKGRFILVYRLGEDGDLKNEGDGMLSVWALRARSYKTKAEA